MDRFQKAALFGWGAKPKVPRHQRPKEEWELEDFVEEYPELKKLDFQDIYRQAEQRVLEREVKKHFHGSPSSLFAGSKLLSEKKSMSNRSHSVGIQKAASFGAMMGKRAGDFSDWLLSPDGPGRVFNSGDPEGAILRNALGYGSIGGVGGAAAGGLYGLLSSDKKKRGALARALAGAAKGGLLGASAGGLLGGGTAAAQIYQPIGALKALIKSRSNVIDHDKDMEEYTKKVNELRVADLINSGMPQKPADPVTYKELRDKDRVGSIANLGAVPYTLGLLDTWKMNRGVDDVFRDISKLPKDISHFGQDLGRFLGLTGPRKHYAE